MAKIIILLRNIIKFIISQFKVLTIFYLMYEYFRSFLRISHEFCIFDLDQSILFFILGISCKTCDYSAPTVKYGTHLLRFSNIPIFLTIDLSGKHVGRKHISSVKKKVLSRRIIQKNVSFRSSQVKIYINSQICICVLYF